jgi:S-adenosylmethionine:tRNA ribosyltransferase-isomerase
MNPGDFNYDLPAELIAQVPLSSRTDSRLLRVDPDGACSDLRFSELSEFIEPGDLLVLNDTRVIPARVHGRKSTGGRFELLLERQLDSDLALVQLKSSRSPGVGSQLHLDCGIDACVEERRENFYVLRFTEPVAEIFETHGHMPLPPYIKRTDDDVDRERYQTVYARHPGAVAAPTAGLHFDHAQLNRLRSRGVDVAALTLHVGAGTFQPLRRAQLEEGKLHAERVEVSASLCAAVTETRQRGGKVVAVGTTTVRALETAALAGAGEGGMRPIQGETDLLIVPGFRFQVVDALLTNFHLPESSLLMLVCAFAGTRKALDAYAHAVRNEYRFYSYGDAMFCYRAGPTESGVDGEANAI